MSSINAARDYLPLLYTNSMKLGDLEKQLWAAADKLRGNISPSDYKYVVLGLIFLKYVSDAFDRQHQKAIDENYPDPEDKDYYLMDNIFWVPADARWQHLVDNAKQPTIGRLVDDAMIAIERENPALKGVLPKDYAREALDKQRLGELIDLFTNIKFDGRNSVDLLGQVYEYFMGMFADSEGRHGGEFYTPRSIVKLLVEMIQPFSGRVYDPCCGSGGMFVWSEEFVREHQGRTGDIAIYGQELNETTWRLAKMNLAIRGIEADIRRGDTLRNDQLPDLRAEYILANPPFNISDWGAEQLANDQRFKFGLPPNSNANFAWMQHMIYHLAHNGTAGIVLANGSLSSNTGTEGDIRKNIVEADLVDCIVSLPAKLFFNVAIPCSLWFLSRDRSNRSGKTLFIDGRDLGHLVSRRSRELSKEDIDKVADIYHKFKSGENIEPELGFSKVANIDDIREQDFVLTPGRYVGVKPSEEDSEPFEQKMPRLIKQLNEQFDRSHELEKKIRQSLKEFE